MVTLAALTVVSGFVDAVSFLGLGHVFTANMTGNVVLIGFAAAGAPGFSMAASLSALGAFLAGAVAGGRLAQRVRPVRNLLLVAMVIEAACTAAAAVVAGTVPTVGSGWPRFAIIGLWPWGWVFATPPSVASGSRHDDDGAHDDLTGLASGSVLAGGTNPHARLGTTTVLCMFGGALVGAVLVLHAGAAWSLGVAAGIVTAATVFLYREVPLELTSP